MTQQTTDADASFILATGASSGIGREMAVQLSAAHRVILSGRDAVRLEETRQRCTAPEAQLIWRHDLSDVDSLAGALSQFLSTNNARVSSFIHCAGLLKILPLNSLTLQQTRDMLNTNFLSAMEITRALMKRKVNGRQLRSIVFISSIASKFGAKGFSAYCASKGALDALMRALAVELAPEVRVNSVLPGGIRTAMTQPIFDDPEMAARLQRDYPLGTGQPRDVIDLVEFLISDSARWITGQQMVVDGGRTSNVSA